MPGKYFFLSLFASLLTACISISVDSDAPPQPDFVTSTLMPTKAVFVPATVTPPQTTGIPPAITTTAPAGCKDSSVLLRDVTVPDDTRMNAGEIFTKTWEFQNNGTCPWMDYTLMFAAGDRMGAPSSAPIPNTLPGETVQVTVELTAPAMDGLFTAYFTLNTPSGRDVPIGTEKTFWVRIVVGNLLPQPTTSDTAPTLFVPKGGNSGCAYTQNAGYVQELITRINQARAEANLPALAVHAQLTEAAQGHSADMACNNFLDHSGSDGSWIGDRLDQAGYPANYYVEIIAVGTPQDAMRQWRADPPHWEAVLDPNATEFGVGYAYFADSDFGGYFTVDFGGLR
jgi:uncharacterized protein YkwD